MSCDAGPVSLEYVQLPVTYVKRGVLAFRWFDRDALVCERGGCQIARKRFTWGNCMHP